VHCLGLELKTAKNEFAKKEAELAEAFAKVEYLLNELTNLRKHKVSHSVSRNGEHRMEELDQLRLELEVSQLT